MCEEDKPSEEEDESQGSATIYHVEIETATLGTVIADILVADLTDTDGKEVILILPLE